MREVHNGTKNGAVSTQPWAEIYSNFVSFVEPIVINIVQQSELHARREGCFNEEIFRPVKWAVARQRTDRKSVV